MLTVTLPVVQEAKEGYERACPRGARRGKIGRRQDTLDGDGLILEADPLPSDLVALLRTVKPELLHVLVGREAAKIAANDEPPPDCLPQRWVAAQDGLQRFVADGWGDQASLLGWTVAELYRVPPVWARVDLTGAALLIADRRVIAVTEASIAIEILPARSSSFAGSDGSIWHSPCSLFPRGDCVKKIEFRRSAMPLSVSSSLSLLRLRRGAASPEAAKGKQRAEDQTT